MLYGARFNIKRGLIADGVQLYHGLSNELPIGIHKTGIRSVVTIHDLIFLRYPEFYAPIDRKIYNFKFRYACKVADRVIAVSECTKRDIMKYYHIPAEKIDVVYQGCDERFSVQVNMEEKEEIRIRYNLPEKYILNVGSIDPVKIYCLQLKHFGMYLKTCIWSQWANIPNMLHRLKIMYGRMDLKIAFICFTVSFLKTCLLYIS